jgi:hypothetical protein
MTPRTRKLVGTFLLLLMLAIYTLVMMVVATAVLPQSGGLVQLLFYAFAGLAWALPAALLISWMHRARG